MLRALGLFNAVLREFPELAYEFEQPFVLDTTKYQSTFGTDTTPLATAIAATVAWYQSQNGPPSPRARVEGMNRSDTHGGVVGAGDSARADSPTTAPFRPIFNSGTGEGIEMGAGLLEGLVGPANSYKQMTCKMRFFCFCGRRLPLREVRHAAQLATPEALTLGRATSCR